MLPVAHRDAEKGGAQVLLLVSVPTTSRSLGMHQLWLILIGMGHIVVMEAQVGLICRILPPRTPPTLGLIMLMVVVVVWRWLGWWHHQETPSSSNDMNQVGS